MRLGSIIPILLHLVEVEVHVKQIASVFYVNFIMELVWMLITKYGKSCGKFYLFLLMHSSFSINIDKYLGDYCHATRTSALCKNRKKKAKEKLADAAGVSKFEVKERTIKTRLDSAIRRSFSNVVGASNPISYMAGKAFKSKVRQIVTQIRDITYFGSLLGNMHVLLLVEGGSDLPLLNTQFYQQCFRVVCGNAYNPSPEKVLQLELSRESKPGPFKAHLMKMALQETYNEHFSTITYQKLALELKTLDQTGVAANLSMQAGILAANLATHVSENFDKLIQKQFVFKMRQEKKEWP
jgi:hypothetical protein